MNKIIIALCLLVIGCDDYSQYCTKLGKELNTEVKIIPGPRASGNRCWVKGWSHGN